MFAFVVDALIGGLQLDVLSCVGGASILGGILLLGAENKIYQIRSSEIPCSGNYQHLED